MTFIPYLIAYLAVGVFLVAVIARTILWLRMPIHIRWELYPVAHEGKKASYGGSYLEDSEWWKRPREVSLWGEIKAMVPEILFLVALKEHNPPMWRRSFPFHFGLYLLVGCTVLMGIKGVGSALSVQIPAQWDAVLSMAVEVLGVGGLVLGLVGALGLLQRRISSDDLKGFTTPADYFNLIFFVIALGVSLAGFLLTYAGFFGSISSFVSNLFALNFVPLEGSGAAVVFPVVSVILMGLLLAYIPLTHMSHFIGKYFAYHSVRWNDTPTLPNSKEEIQIAEVLGRRVTWSAAHIQGNGKKTWAEVATNIPGEEGTK